jgi:hypothetical protein
MDQSPLFGVEHPLRQFNVGNLAGEQLCRSSTGSF